jgi:parallel beta-helix repeat protein
MHSTLRIALLLLVAGTALSLPARAAADTYYVASDGSDGAAGTESNPWRTLQHAADSVSAGDTVFVGDGTYRGFTINRSGTPSAWLVFRNAEGAHPQIDGGGATAHVVTFDSVHDVKLWGFRIRGANAFLGAGVEVDFSSNIGVSGNAISDNQDIGVHVYQSTNVNVMNNWIHDNAIGIEVKYGGAGVRIINNRIYDNTSMVINDGAGGNDSGAVGVNFLKTSGPTLAQGNVLWNNRARSHDYGYDGGAWEIYGASNVTITGNVSYNNETVLETGTDSGKDCANNEFSRNVAWGASTAPLGNAVGLTLRCATNMLVANNTFSDIDWWVFNVNLGGGFADSVAGLRIVNNIVTQSDSKIYAIGSGLPGSVVIDHNLAYSYGGYGIASVAGRGTTSSMATFNDWTGYEAHGVQADPRYADRWDHDYHLPGSSPAINAGVPIPGVTDGFLGGAPDLGAYEAG